jgi:hypothetical protein
VHVLEDKAIPRVAQYPYQPFMGTNAIIYSGFFSNVEDVVFHFSIRKRRLEDGAIVEEFDDPR